MMVIFLCGLVALILIRTLRNDFARYAKDDDIDMEGMNVGEDSGWKQVLSFNHSISKFFICSFRVEWGLFNNK